MYCGYIVELKSLRKHDNADRLLCTEVFGNNVIVSTDCYHEGQLCVFFPIDGKIGLEFAEKNNLLRKKDENGRNIGGYLDPEKRNVRALKLRGERSEGLLLPIESLSDYANIKEFKVGDQITILNNITICEKYMPVNKKSSSDLKGTNDKKQKSKIIDYPLFLEHYDTPQLAYKMNNHKCIKCKKVFTFNDSETKWNECSTYSEKLVKCPLCNAINPLRYVDAPGLHVNSDIEYYLYKN